ncbi:MAG: integrase [Deltaproteobacteria bacterium]|nr:integrase [Deltaproteobacteria bacterium]
MGKKRSTVTVHARKDQGGRILKKSRLEAAAKVHAGRALSKASETAYEALWGGFEAWCYDFGEQALPASPGTVAQYLTDQAATDHKAATLDSILAAIQHHHRVAGLSSPHDHPDVQAVRSGIRRELGTAQRRVEPMLVDVLERVVTALPNTLAGARDRALLLFGFASALRRSELVALEVADLRRTAEGYQVRIRRSKTDQEGRGRAIGVPVAQNPALCPVDAVEAWLQVARIRSGGIFRGVDKHGHVDPRPLSGRAVALIAKRSFC